MPYRKTAPPHQDIVRTKRGIVFSFHLKSNGSELKDTTTTGFDESTNGSIDLESVSNDSPDVSHPSEILLHPSQSDVILQPPTNANSSNVRATYGLQPANSSYGSLPLANATYELEVDIHNVTSTRLLDRMDKSREDRGDLPFSWSSKPSSSAASSYSGSPQKGGGMIGNIGFYKKRKVQQTSSVPGECTWCGVKKTAQWRKGPTGARGLCNRCGIEWAKQIRQSAKINSISNATAEARLVGTYRTSERFKRFSREHLMDNMMEDADR